MFHSLAERTALQIVIREPDEKKIPDLRRFIERSVLGDQVTVVHGSLTSLPYTDHLFNLIVYPGFIDGKTFQGDMAELKRVLRPHGGVLVTGPTAKDIFRAGPFLEKANGPTNTATPATPHVAKTTGSMAS